MRSPSAGAIDYRVTQAAGTVLGVLCMLVTLPAALLRARRGAGKAAGKGRVLGAHQMRADSEGFRVAPAAALAPARNSRFSVN